MRPDLAVVLFTLFSSAVASAIDGPLHIKRVDSAPSADEHDLYKRRGGGGGGGRGGSSGGGSRGGSSGSRGGSSSSGSRGGSSSGGGSSSSRGSSSGSSRSGSGSGSGSSGGRSGGASRPYAARGPSPSGIRPVLLGAGVAALAFWPGVWLYGAYMYHYPNSYRYYNETSEEEEDRPILCACSAEASCGCDQDDNTNNTALYDELIGNGSYEHLNKSIVDVAEVNGTTTILINGTLPDDTALPEEDSDSAAARAMIEAMGYWPAAAAVLAAVLIA
ncbi:hypothetical protein FPOAC1_012360 [Fusarium poae]|uniref:hypothetical protein n=1 Tax=Fusarium poae TaxID=36050 RepID=UPI001CE8BF19|nr:hypothetical protein FPOAC1_012360 [Fusarium poae]KAG8667527.1 hypothetical protein FPOAC1_012360 [Fusarium poae]